MLVPLKPADLKVGDKIRVGGKKYTVKAVGKDSITFCDEDGMRRFIGHDREDWYMKARMA